MAISKRITVEFNEVLEKKTYHELIEKKVIEFKHFSEITYSNNFMNKFLRFNYPIKIKYDDMDGKSYLNYYCETIGKGDNKASLDLKYNVFEERIIYFGIISFLLLIGIFDSLFLNNGDFYGNFEYIVVSVLTIGWLIQSIIQKRREEKNFIESFIYYLEKFEFIKSVSTKKPN